MSTHDAGGGDAMEGYGAGAEGFESTPLDRYLDGLMSAEEAAAFEATLAGDAALRHEVEMQRRIDASLRSVFAPPARIELRGRGSDPAAGPAEGAVVATLGPEGDGAGGARRRRQRLIGLATAAGLALAAAGGGAYWWMFIGVEAPYRQPAQIYQAQAANSFTPEWVCTTDEEFARTVRERFGEPALLPLATSGVQIVGWAYNTPVLSNRTATLMTRVEGRDVLVLIDGADRDVNLRRAGEVAGVGPLRLFKRRLGGLVLYEVTPLDSARVIPAFTGGE